MVPEAEATTAPEGWPKAGRPLSVAILGWARLSLQAREGSGYNLSASELAAGLALCGHRVSYLASGVRYRPRPGAFIRFRETWRAVRCYDLFNSPNHAPAALNFGNLGPETDHAGQAAVVLRWLDRVAARVVHVHSLEGYPLGLIAAVRATGRPVVVTPHNHWYVCPQVDLLHRESVVCDDYEGGRRCETCLPEKRYWRQRAARTVGQGLEETLGHGVADMIRKAAYGLAGNGAEHRPPRPPRGVAPSLPLDPELARGFDAGGPRAADGRVGHGLAIDPADPRERPRPFSAAPIDANERFLSEPSRVRHLAVVNDFGRRRRAGVAALNAASLVTPPSDFLRRVLVAMGVEEARTRVVRLGQPHFDQIHRRAARSPFYGDRPWNADRATGPLRLAFFGTTRPNKGLEVLVRAIGLLAPGVRRRCQFLVRAAGWDWPFRKRVSEYPEVQFAGGYDLLQLIGAWGEYDVGLLPHIWFENSPLVLLEHLHAGKLVISSRLGGPAEWLVEPGPGPGNALACAAGDPASLAECITRVATGAVALPSPREVHAATPHLQSYPGHVAEVCAIYDELAGA